MGRPPALGLWREKAWKVDKRFIKACEGPKAEEKSENGCIELLEFLDQTEEAEEPGGVSMWKELSEDYEKSRKTKDSSTPVRVQKQRRRARMLGWSC